MENKEIKILLGIMLGASFLLVLLFSPWENIQQNSKQNQITEDGNIDYHIAGFSQQQTNYMYNMIIDNSESLLFDFTKYISFNNANLQSHDFSNAANIIVGVYNNKSLKEK
jgi:hypothetical protein